MIYLHPSDWTPKAGDRVRIVSHSTVTGRLINVRLGEVTKTTSAGFAYVRGASDKYHIGGPGPWRQWRPRRNGSPMICSRIEPSRPEDEGVLPDTGAGGSRYARDLIAAGRDKEFPR